jgi:hypothetical protein
MGFTARGRLIKPEILNSAQVVMTMTWRYSVLLRELGQLFRLFMNLNRSTSQGKESFKITIQIPGASKRRSQRSQFRLQHSCAVI